MRLNVASGAGVGLLVAGLAFALTGLHHAHDAREAPPT
jgi:hypothetical protein